MKVVIASDIHGSEYYTKKLIERYADEKAEQLILLGDLYYHGPRNAFTEEYMPMNVSNMLNEIAEKILCVRGNCDSEIDEMISNFGFVENAQLYVSSKKVFLSHGHKLVLDETLKRYGDIVIYGHYHTGFIRKEGNFIVANAGSVSLPRNNTKNSYIVLTDKLIELKDIDGNVLESEAII